MPSISQALLTRRLTLGALGVLGGSGIGATPPLQLLAASDLKFALAPVLRAYQRATGQVVGVTFGSSGNLARQLQQGLRADIFMSADEALALQLSDAGLTQGPGAVYALGRLALLAARDAGLPLDSALQGLGRVLGATGGPTQTVKLALANPDHAPYGRAAREALRRSGLWERAQPHLVLGDNAAQAAQFVALGVAAMGLVPLALAVAPELAAQTRFVVIDAALHAPLRQRMVLLNARPQAAALFAFLQSAATQSLLHQHGLERPPAD